ncbi:MAG: glycosyltransferase family 4 protein [Candidatus Thermoplasmatota archaeon]|nr:glycosyltransferase family 4 protein [Candidatus Thermoplasmatota archaeon]
MKINIFTEAELAGIKTTGIVTSYKTLKEGLEKQKIEVSVNKKNGYDLLHVHSFGPLSLLKAMREKKPVVMTTHTVPEEISILYWGGRYIQKIFDKYLIYVYNQSDMLISPSNFAKTRLQELGVKSKIVVESNGIKKGNFSKSKEKRKIFREKFDIGEDEVVIGCVGLPSKRKGLDVFHEVSKKHPDKKFIWIGENIYNKLLKDYKYLKILEENSNDNFILTGFVDDIQAAYSAMDIFMLPTMIETEGLVVLEAISSDLPVITSKVQGLDWIKEKNHCLKASNIQEYTEAINDLLENPEKTKKMIEKSKDLLSKKDINQVIPRIIELYKTLIVEGS